VKDRFQKFPIYPVVRLLKIKLDCHEARLGFTSLEAMENFLDNDLIFSYPPIWYKGWLGRRDHFV